MELPLGLRHEHGADAGALRPQDVGPQAVTDEDSILRAEPRPFERRLVNARMRLSVASLGRCDENVDAAARPAAAISEARSHPQLEHTAMVNPARLSSARQSAAPGKATMAA